MSQFFVIVEGKDDQALVNYLWEGDAIQFLVTGGSDQKAISDKITAFLFNLNESTDPKLAIILDEDNNSLASVNEALCAIIPGAILAQVAVFQDLTIQGRSVSIGCFFVGPENLDILLQKNIPAKYLPTRADRMVACLPKVTPREKAKSWLFYFIRWDVSTAEDRKNAKKNLAMEHILLKNIWPKDAPYFQEMRAFLSKMI